MSKAVIIRNGLIMDQSNGVFRAKKTILIKGGKIARIFDADDAQSGHVTVVLNDVDEIFEAEGYFVSPGFIDAHAHVLEYATQLGVNPDKTCLPNGKCMG